MFWICFLSVYYGYIFFSQKIDSIPREKFFLTLVIRTFPKMWNYWWIYLLVIIIFFNFQIRQIPATNQRFSWEWKLYFYQGYFYTGQDFEKKLTNFHETNFYTRKIIQKFEGHFHWNCRHITFWVTYDFSKWMK